MFTWHDCSELLGKGVDVLPPVGVEGPGGTQPLSQLRDPLHQQALAAHVCGRWAHIDNTVYSNTKSTGIHGGMYNIVYWSKVNNVLKSTRKYRKAHNTLKMGALRNVVYTLHNTHSNIQDTETLSGIQERDTGNTLLYGAAVRYCCIQAVTNWWNRQCYTRKRTTITQRAVGQDTTQRTCQ